MSLNPIADSLKKSIADLGPRAIDTNAIRHSADASIASLKSKSAATKAATEASASIFYSANDRKYWIGGRGVPLSFDTLDYLANATDLPMQASAPAGYVPVAQHTLASYRDLVKSQMEGTAKIQFWDSVQSGAGSIATAIPRLLGWDIKNPWGDESSESYDNMTLRQQAGTKETAFSSMTGFKNNLGMGLGSIAAPVVGAGIAALAAPEIAGAALLTGTALNFMASAGSNSEQIQQVIASELGELSEEQRRAGSDSYATMRDHGVSEAGAINQVSFEAGQAAGMWAGVTTIPESIIGGKLIGNMVRRTPGLSKLMGEVTDTATKTRLGLSGAVDKKLAAIPAPLRFLVKTTGRSGAAAIAEGTQEETENVTALTAGHISAGIGSRNPLDYVDGKNFESGAGVGLFFGLLGGGGKGKNSPEAESLGARPDATAPAVDEPPPIGEQLELNLTGGDGGGGGGLPLRAPLQESLNFGDTGGAPAPTQGEMDFLGGGGGDAPLQGTLPGMEPGAASENVGGSAPYTGATPSKAILIMQQLDAMFGLDWEDRLNEVSADVRGRDLLAALDAIPDEETQVEGTSPQPDMNMSAPRQEVEPSQEEWSLFQQMQRDELQDNLRTRQDERAVASEAAPLMLTDQGTTSIENDIAQLQKAIAARPPRDPRLKHLKAALAAAEARWQEAKLAQGPNTIAPDGLTLRRDNSETVPTVTEPEPAGDIKKQIANMVALPPEKRRPVFVTLENEAQIPVVLPPGVKAYFKPSQGTMLTTDPAQGAAFKAGKFKTDKAMADVLALGDDKATVAKNAAEAGAPVVGVQAITPEGDVTAETMAVGNNEGVEDAAANVAGKLASTTDADIVVNNTPDILNRREAKLDAEAAADIKPAEKPADTKPAAKPRGAAAVQRASRSRAKPADTTPAEKPADIKPAEKPAAKGNKGRAVVNASKNNSNPTKEAPATPTTDEEAEGAKGKTISRVSKKAAEKKTSENETSDQQSAAVEEVTPAAEAVTPAAEEVTPTATPDADAAPNIDLKAAARRHRAIRAAAERANVAKTTDLDSKPRNPVVAPVVAPVVEESEAEAAAASVLEMDEDASGTTSASNTLRIRKVKRSNSTAYVVESNYESDTYEELREYTTFVRAREAAAYAVKNSLEAKRQKNKQALPPTPTKQDFAAVAKMIVALANQVMLDAKTLANITNQHPLWQMITGPLHEDLTKYTDQKKRVRDLIEGLSVSKQEAVELMLSTALKRRQAASTNDTNDVDKLKINNNTHSATTGAVPEAARNLANAWAKLFQRDLKAPLPDRFVIMSMEEAHRFHPDMKKKLLGLPSVYYTRMVDGKEHHYIAIDWAGFAKKPGGEAAALEAMAHEFGHFAGQHAFKHSTKETKIAVKKAWNLWRQNNANKPSNQILEESLTPALAEHFFGEIDTDPAYANSVKEFLANQTAAWLLTSKEPKSLVEKFFASVASYLKNLYSQLVNGKPNSPQVISEIADMLNSFTADAKARAARPTVDPVAEEMKANPEIKPSKREEFKHKANKKQAEKITLQIHPLVKAIRAMYDSVISPKNHRIVAAQWNHLKSSWVGKTIGEFRLKLMTTHQIADLYANVKEGNFGESLRGLVRVRDEIDARAKALQARAANALSKAHNMDGEVRDLLQQAKYYSTYYDMNPELEISGTGSTEYDKDGKVVRSNKHILNDELADGTPVVQDARVIAAQHRRYNTLRSIWNKMAELDGTVDRKPGQLSDSQKIFIELRDALEDLRVQMIKTKQANLDEFMRGGKPLSLDAIEAILKRHKAQLEAKRRGPYFPLMRFGDWIVKVKLPSELYGDGGLINGGAKEFTDKKSAKKEASNLREMYPGATVTVQKDEGGEELYTVRVFKYGVYFFDSPAAAAAAKEDIEKEVRDEYTVRNADFDAHASQLEKDQLELPEGQRESMISEPYRKLDFFTSRYAAPDSQFAAKIRGIFSDDDVSGSVKNSVEELLLDSLQEFSSRKSDLHRNNILGASKDMLNAYSRRFAGASHTLATIEKSEALNNYWKAVVAARESFPPAGAVANVINENDQLVRDRTNGSLGNRFLNGVSDLNSAYTLGWSPSYILANAAQVSMITAPYLASLTGRDGKAIGWAKSGKYIKQAYTGAGGYFTGRGAEDFMSEMMKVLGKKSRDQVGDTEHAAKMIEKFAANPEEAAMLQGLIDRGRLDFSFLNSMQDAMRSGELGSKLGASFRLGMVFPQQVEAMNRITTALATYRMAKAEMDFPSDATEGDYISFVDDVVRKTQLDYSRKNRPAFFNRPFVGMALQFRLYMQGMYMLFVENAMKALKGQAEGESLKAYQKRRSEGTRIIRNLMMTHMAVGGATGISPIVWMASAPLKLLAGAASLAGFGSDDDDEDKWLSWDDMVKSYAKDMFGDTGGEVLMHGLPALINMDLSQKLGMPNLVDTKYMGLSDRDKPSNVLDASMVYALGSPYSNLRRGVDAAGETVSTVKSLARGQTQEATYHATQAAKGLPAGARAAVRSMIFGSQGVLDNDGDVFMSKDELSLSGLVIAGLGFQTADLARKYEQRSAEKGAKGRMMTERNMIKSLWRSGDAEDKAALYDRLKAYNKSVPPHFQLTMEQLAKSEAAQEERNAGATNKQDAEVKAMLNH